MAAAEDKKLHGFYTGTRADLTQGDRFYHGTRAHLNSGDLIKPGHPANFGKLDRITTYVYFSATVDAAIWGSELSRGEGPGRIYVVEPTGPFTDDPNLTDKKFPGNPTKSGKKMMRPAPRSWASC